uniref:MRN complex-interacting protein N-terminal domain-containing protein n=1 Tax=Apteryx owenii TaxID=8824 RepID=A0A8B9PZE3_APTOW
MGRIFRKTPKNALISPISIYVSRFPEPSAVSPCKCLGQEGLQECSSLVQRALFSLFSQVYGEGSGLDCRLHVQKLNLLQGEAEEALSWTSR